MKNSSLGSLIAASALAVAPSAAFAQDASTPTGPTTPEPAPVLTTPAASTPVGTSITEEPQATDPVISSTPSSKRRQRNKEAQDSQADRTPAPKDATPDVQATDPSIIGPSALEVQAVPNFFIEDFDIPPFLLPIYQAAGSEYGIRWEVLASINRVETAFGTNLNVSSAGALGWMQFMPSTWEQYGVDANGDGQKDPFNPADAIFAAARYLKAAGGDTDLRKAVFAYNHADWYVNQVMDGASQIASIPEPIISSLAALTQGLFPIDAADRSIAYRGKLKTSGDEKKVAPGDDASDTVEGDSSTNSIEVDAPAGSRVVAVQDGVIEKVGKSERLGTYVRLRDAYGNRYTYAHLGDVQERVPVPKPAKDDSGKSRSDDETTTDDATATAPGAATTTVDPNSDPTPTTPATATSDDPAPTQAATETTTPSDTTLTDSDPSAPKSRSRLAARSQDETVAESNPADTPRRIRFRARNAIESPEASAEPASTDKARLFAHPTRPESYAAGGEEQLNPQLADTTETTEATDSLAEYFSIDYGLKASDVRLHKLKEGTKVIAGTVLGRLPQSTDGSDTATLSFEIRPAGKKAPRIDPKPILDGWRLMDRTAFYKAQVKEAVKAGEAGDDVSAGQVLLMSKAELSQRVLTDKRINIYECGRRDIKAGIVDRRILALLEFLAIKGIEPSVSSLQCGHGLMTASGNVSEHSTGTAVDISSVYGTTISPATQGEGSVTDKAVREILKLQGAMKPHQIITLMQYAGTDNTLALADHYDHIHVGYRPVSGNGGKRLEQLLKPGQWDNLLQQLDSLKVPSVSAAPSQYSVTVRKAKKKK